MKPNQEQNEATRFVMLLFCGRLEVTEGLRRCALSLQQDSVFLLDVEGFDGGLEVLIGMLLLMIEGVLQLASGPPP